MTRDEIVSEGNTRLQTIIDRVRAETAEVERQRLEALNAIPGVEAVLQQFANASAAAESDRQRALSIKDAALAKVRQDAADERYATVGKVLDTYQDQKTEADRVHHDAIAEAESDYNDALRDADHLVTSIDAKDSARRDAKTKRDATIRHADRAYQKSNDAADRQYTAEYSAAFTKEADMVEGAMRQAAADQVNTEIAYDEALHHAEEEKHKALVNHPPTGAVQEAFDTRRADVQRQGEQDKTAVLVWMRAELAKLGG